MGKIIDGDMEKSIVYDKKYWMLITMFDNCWYNEWYMNMMIMENFVIDEKT